MIINKINSNQYKINFKNQLKDQNEKQMPLIREKMDAAFDYYRYGSFAKSFDEISKNLALAQINIQNGKTEAALKNIQNADKKTTQSIKEINKQLNKPDNKILETLLLCCSQSNSQQDKHKAIRFFNMLYKKEPESMSIASFIGMANVFRNLDRSYDEDEIKTCEGIIKNFYKEQNDGIKLVMLESYSDNELIDFNKSN